MLSSSRTATTTMSDERQAARAASPVPYTCPRSSVRSWRARRRTVVSNGSSRDFDGATDTAVADEEHRAIGEARMPRGRPRAGLGRAHEVRDVALRRQDQRQRHLGRRRLVHRGGVGEHHVLGQVLGDAVVAERETLHEPDVETVEVRETLPGLQVRRDHDVDVLARRRTGHVPLHDLDVARAARPGCRAPARREW